MSKMTIGEKITYARKKRGFSQKRLSDAIGVSSQQMNHWEKGVRNPKMESLNRISSILRLYEGYFNEADSANLDQYFISDGEDFMTIGDSVFRMPGREDYLRLLIEYARQMTDEEVKDLFEYAVKIVLAHRQNDE